MSSNYKVRFLPNPTIPVIANHLGIIKQEIIPGFSTIVAADTLLVTEQEVTVPAAANNIKFAVVQGAAPTSVTTQTFTKSGFGTPVAAIFFASWGTANGTRVNHASYGCGFTDGTASRDRVMSNSDQDNVTPKNNSWRSMGRSKCIRLLNPTSNATIEGEANWDAWVTDGIRISWTTAPAAAHLINCILIGGSDAVAYVSETNLAGSGNTNIVHQLGETPVLAFMQGTTASPTGASNNLSHNFGVLTYQGSTITQRLISDFALDNTDTADNTTYIANNRIFGSLAGGGTGISRMWEATVVDSTNITLTHRGPSAFGGDVQCLAIGFGTATNEVELGSINGPTTTGTASKTTTNSWQPQFIGLGFSGSLAENTFESTASAAHFSFGIIDADNEYSTAFATEDAVDPADTHSVTANKAIHAIDGDTANNAFIGTILTGSGSINTDGFTINWTEENKSSAVKGFWLAVEKN